MRRLLVLAFLSAAAMQAAATWFDLVAPIMSSAEKKTYQSLNAEARAAFEQNFWTEKSIEADEYFRRLQYMDSTFGSSKTGFRREHRSRPRVSVSRRTSTHHASPFVANLRAARDLVLRNSSRPSYEWRTAAGVLPEK